MMVTRPLIDPFVCDNHFIGRPGRTPTRTRNSSGPPSVVRRADRHGVAIPVLRAALCTLEVYEARVRK
jgi:hypothetical protein